MNLVVEIKLKKETRAVAYYQDISTDGALYEIKNIIDNFNENLSWILSNKNSTIAAIFIIIKECDEISKWHSLPEFSEGTVKLLEEEFSDEWEEMSHLKSWGFQDARIAIDKEGMEDFLYDDLEVEDGFITIDFDKNKIKTKKIYNEMSGFRYACRNNIDPKYLNIEEFVLFDSSIQSFSFNDLCDVIYTVEKYKGWRLESDPNYLYIKRG